MFILARKVELGYLFDSDSNSSNHNPVNMPSFTDLLKLHKAMRADPDHNDVYMQVHDSCTGIKWLNTSTLFWNNGWRPNPNQSAHRKVIREHEDWVAPYYNYDYRRFNK